MTFESRATNLIQEDGNGSSDVFVRDLGECFSFTLGDSNCDGLTTNADIDAFVLGLLDPDLYRQLHPNCNLLCNNDMNGDGVVDNGDIDAFVGVLLKH